MNSRPPALPGVRGRGVPGAVPPPEPAPDRPLFRPPVPPLPPAGDVPLPPPPAPVPAGSLAVVSRIGGVGVGESPSRFLSASSTVPGLSLPRASVPSDGVGAGDVGAGCSSSPNAARSSATLVRPRFSASPELWARSGLERELLDDRRLESDLGRDNRIRLPAQRFEDDELGPL